MELGGSEGVGETIEIRQHVEIVEGGEAGSLRSGHRDRGFGVAIGTEEARDIFGSASRLRSRHRGAPCGRARRGGRQRLRSRERQGLEPRVVSPSIYAREFLDRRFLHASSRRSLSREHDIDGVAPLIGLFARDLRFKPLASREGKTREAAPREVYATVDEDAKESAPQDGPEDDGEKAYARDYSHEDGEDGRSCGGDERGAQVSVHRP